MGKQSAFGEDPRWEAGYFCKKYSMKTRIAVLSGGYSHEAQISRKSASTVMRHLPTEGYDLMQIDISEEGWFALSGDEKIPVDKNDFSVIVNGKKHQFDAAFIVIHGTPGEDGKLQGYFDMLKLPYTTSGVLTSALSFNKFACNTLLSQMGIRCSKSLIIRKGDPINSEKIAKAIGFPMFIKPSDGGSSFGVSKVKKAEEIEIAISTALEHGTEALIEAFVNGTEVTCGVFSANGNVTVFHPTEIVTENEFFDFDAKYQGKSKEITPARLSEEVTNLVRATTAEVYRLLNLRGMARVDFIIQENVPFMIEVNTVPGLSDASILPQQARHAGIELSTLFASVLEDALKP